MIEKPFESPEGWVRFLSDADIPVLRHSMVELGKLREQAETVNGRHISSVILTDPLMTLRVLNYIESRRRQRQHTDITTIDRAIMMIGIGPFFTEFDQMPTVEEQLAPHPQALLGLLRVINRARKAARWAHDWAVMRHDLDVDEITVATLLRYGAEMLMWTFAPSLALSVRKMQLENPTLRSSVAQKSIYGISLNELGVALSKSWHLPELIATLMDPSQAENPRVRNVTLACDLARHASNSWDDPALPDDFKGICELLHLNQETLFRKLGLDDHGHPLQA